MKLNKKKIKNLNILVIGDLCLDRYWGGNVERISPEGPIPILNVKKVESRLGMAGNVALNLRALGAKVELFTVLGEEDNTFIIDQLMQHKVKPSILTSSNHKNIYKNRLVSNNQILYRFDQESHTKLDFFEEQRIKDTLLANIKSYDAVVISDYGKGFFSEALVKHVVGLCQINKVHCFIDPDIKKPIEVYKNSYLVKLNEKEFKDWNVKTSAFNHYFDNLVVTFGGEGMGCKQLGVPKFIEAKIDSKGLVDSCGAGDSALAILTVCQSLGLSIKESMRIANLGAGLAVQKMGTVQVSLEELNKLL